MKIAMALLTDIDAGLSRVISCSSKSTSFETITTITKDLTNLGYHPKIKH